MELQSVSDQTPAAKFVLIPNTAFQASAEAPVQQININIEQKGEERERD